ncbi:AIPR family protein [Bifidobacterium sp. ESL0769]|uniref:AIPR family protein n=1 Tax=Bifidobacterium sp. ESL0769 TaxID=2983229 RepID=UPI0023F9E06D|nr:AIPR family protein [Bifidobacterium sp. ESL0769]WEV67047.1 AIPR family protein [Bifidobacterium sp. ESL0769]
MVEQIAINCFDSFMNSENDVRVDPALLTEKDKARFGFYFLVLSIKTGITEFDVLDNMIIDTDYLAKIHGVQNDDLGVDAVYINDEESTINLFNFKYRENYKKGSSLSDKVVLDAGKFIAGVQNGSMDLSGLTACKTKTKLQKIQQIYDESNQDWSMNLILVSNEDNGLSQNAREHQKLFLVKNQIHIDGFVLPDIVDALAEKPGTGNRLTTAKIRVKSDEMMRHIDSATGNVSYLVTLTMADIIRILGKDSDKRLDCNIEEYGNLENEHLDSGFLFENVRGFLTRSDYNQGILNTIKNDPSNFFTYNNGITIVCEKVRQESKNGNSVSILTIHNYQVVNGGQTVRTMFNSNQDEFSEERLAQVQVLARIFTTEDTNVRSKIAEYTNSQNAISPVDLKSTDHVQLLIEQRLKLGGITYLRKVGDLCKENPKNQSISLELVGQILYAIKKDPSRATNQKKKIFSTEYNNLFPNDDGKFLDNVFQYCEEYFSNKATFKCTKQENLYILYMIHNSNHDIAPEQAFKILKNAEKTYKEDEDIRAPRKLIQPGFRKVVDSTLNIEQ